MLTSLGGRGRRSIGLLLGIGIVMAASAGLALSVTEPNGGSNFDAGDDGWTTPTPPTCAGPITNDLLCTATNERVAEGGNPGGALRSQSTVTVNAGGTFTSEHVWRSPSFAVSTPPFEPSIAYDRRLDAQGLIALDPNAEVKAVLVNESSSTETVLLEDALTGDEDSEWDKRAVGVLAGVLNIGSTYHLELRVTITSRSAQEGLTGSVAVLLDNVGLDLESRDGSSPGVTHPPGSGEDGSSINEGDITLLEGQGPGGSVIPLSKCTIVGTEGDDKIRGTKGNDIICSLAGDDKVNAGKGFDAVDAGADNDRVNGGKKTDLLLGLAGNDSLKGLKGADRIGGGSGRDAVDGGLHNDKMWTRDKDSDRVKGGGGARDRVAADRKDKVKNVPRVKVK